MSLCVFCVCLYEVVFLEKVFVINCDSGPPDGGFGVTVYLIHVKQNKQTTNILFHRSMAIGPYPPIKFYKKYHVFDTCINYVTKYLHFKTPSVVNYL